MIQQIFMHNNKPIKTINEPSKHNSATRESEVMAATKIQVVIYKVFSAQTQVVC